MVYRCCTWEEVIVKVETYSIYKLYKKLFDLQQWDLANEGRSMKQSWAEIKSAIEHAQIDADRKKNTETRKLLTLEPVSLSIRSG